MMLAASRRFSAPLETLALRAMLAGFSTCLIGIGHVNKPIDAGGDMVLAWCGAGGEEALRATCEGRFGVSAVPGRFAAPKYGRSFKCNNGTGAQGLRRLVRAASRGLDCMRLASRAAVAPYDRRAGRRRCERCGLAHVASWRQCRLAGPRPVSLGDVGFHTQPLKTPLDQWVPVCAPRWADGQMTQKRTAKRPMPPTVARKRRFDMSLPLTPNSRPWMKHYAAGVAHDFDPPAMTLTAMISAAFETYGPQVLIEYYGTEYTFDRMKALTAQVAAALKAEGIGKGDRVALHLPNCPWHPIFFFGTIAAGAAVTHLSPLDADREIAHKMKDSGAKLLVSLTTPEFSSHFPGLIASGEVPKLILCPDPVSAKGRECPVIDGAMAAEAFLAPHHGATFAPEAVTPDDMALLQYTGGTTGVPKAAILTHRNLTSAVQMYSESAKGEASQAPEAANLIYSPLFHIMGLTATLLKRTHEGGRLHLRLRYNPEEAVKEIEEKKIAAFAGVPTTWIGLLALPDIDSRDLSSLVYAGSGGAPLPVEVYNRVKQLTGLKIRGGWGMTETSPAGTNVPRNMPDDKLGTIGVPLPGLDMRIVDVEDASRSLAPNEIGEMAIMGPNVTAAYWNKPNETAEAFHDGWFLTGDIGYMDEDGYFFLVDRKKDMILSGGFNVYPLMIENAVHQHPDVAEVMAIGVPDEYRGESCKVFVTLRAGAKEFSLTELQDFLADKLGRHEIPRQLEFRSELPHTPVGKSDRKALKAEEAAKREALETAS